MKPGSSTASGRRAAGARRTASLHHIHPQELLAQVLNALQDRVGFDPADVDDVVIGNGNSIGDQGMCIGRMAVLAAGWPVEAPGITLNRFCGSGQQAVTFAAMGMQAGHQDAASSAAASSRCRAGRSTTAPVDFTAGNPPLREQFPLVPAGHLRRPDRDDRGLRPRRRRRLRPVEPAARRHRDGRGSLRPQRGRRSTTPTARSPSTTTSTRARARRSRASPSSHRRSRRWARTVFAGLRPSFDEMCRQAYPQIESRRARPPRRQLVGRRRRRQRPRPGLALTTRMPTGSRHGRGSS